MKILILSHRFYPNLGGIESISEMFANDLREAGHDVRLLTWTKETGNKKFGFTVVRKPSVYTLFKELLWSNVVLENNPCLRLSWPRFFIRKPAVVTLQTWLGSRAGLHSLQDKLKLYWLKKASFVVSCSDAIRKRCWPAAIVIPNPYNAKLFKTNTAIVRDKDFVFLGRLVSDKGVSLAIRSFQRVLTHTDSLLRKSRKLTIIGNGPELEILKILTEELGIKEHVLFAGAMSGDPLVAFLNEHRFLLVSSIWEEPFGIVALEGMGCGCIPIVSNGGGLPEAVGEAGLVFQRGDEQSMTDAMIQLISNLLLQQQLSAAAPAHLASHQASVVSGKYLEILQSAFNQSNQL